MGLVEKMVREAAEKVGALQVDWGGMDIDLSKPFARVPMLKLLKDATGCDLGDVSDDEIQTVCIKNNIKVDETWNYGQMLDELMSKLVEPNLIQPTFIIDYPKAISPLAKVHRNGDRILLSGMNFLLAVQNSLIRFLN